MKTRKFIAILTCLCCLGSGCRKSDEASIPGNIAFDPRGTGKQSCLPKSVLAYMRFGAIDLDPSRVSNYMDNAITMIAFGQLTGLDEYDNVRPYLAKNWVLSKDGLKYTFTLDEKFRFSNGAKITATDVQFSFTRLFSPKLQSQVGTYLFGDSIKGTDLFQAGKMGHISGIEVLSQNTVRFTLKTPRANFLTMLSMGPASIIPNETKIRPKQAEDIVSSGPFFIKQLLPNRVVLEKNIHYPDYFKLSSIIFKHDDRDICDLLKSEEYDFIDAGPIDFQPCNSPQYVVSRYPGANIWFIAFGRNITPELRKQINSCVEISGYLNSLRENGVAVKALYGLFPGTESALTPKPVQECKLSSQHHLNLYLNKQYHYTEKLSGIFANIKNLDVTVVPLDDNGLKELRKTGDYDMLFTEFTGIFSDPTFFSSLFYSKGSIISTGYKNQEYDKLSEKLASAIRSDEQRHIMSEINSVIASDPPAIFIKQHENIEWVKNSLNLKREGWNNRYFFDSKNPDDCRAPK